MNKKYFEIVKTKILKQLNSEEYIKAYEGTEQGTVDKKHSMEVVDLVKQVWKKYESTDIPEALLIGALVHDSDRYYPKREVNTKNCPKSHYGYRKGIHSGNTALIFFEENSKDLPIELTRDICFLILRHERGGDVDKEMNLFDKKDEFTNSYNLNKAANYLYYADKMSFFSSNIYEYKKRGLEKLKEKILFSIEDLPEEIREEIFSFDFKDKEISTIMKQVETQKK
ncbi:hypothetical protein H6501_01200 [Candidatus Woesearchaeota archaeon]|nr:hypothetical protein [Nanoarchaeota archaeon]MCB9370193.1 hypothetical protein [Candidatus Woesearchaeota archaeon]USN44721.1 MAG: hypothetical protein H6500_02665 [Candidatus Woesearchaeota archaeon]